MKKRVLVVDDDHLVADTLNLIFRAQGYQSEARYSAAEALECARSFHPQLLLCDVSMPRETGLDLIDQVQRELPTTRFLMLTAYANNIDKVHLHSSRTGRPIKLLNKPCRPEELIRTATELLATA